MAVNFERIYSTNLVFQPDCWKLCGDAHCCSFQRYKKNFKLIGSPPGGQLPLLPGEYEWLRQQNLLGEFQEHEHRVTTHQFGKYTLHIEALVAKSAFCPCTQASRTTICRLYPLLPIFDESGRVIAADPVFGSFEVIEELQQLERACKITQMPINEMNKFLAIADEIGRDPVALFYAKAYAMTLNHVKSRLPGLHAARKGENYFSTYEMSLIRSKLIDQVALNGELSALAGRFEERYGSAFSLQ
jgi:hypothetical protein